MTIKRAFGSHVLIFFSVLNTSSLLCDCHMQWLGPWLSESPFLQSVSAVCAHPADLFGRNVLSISPEEFVCGQSSAVSVCFWESFAFHLPLSPPWLLIGLMAFVIAQYDNRVSIRNTNSCAFFHQSVIYRCFIVDGVIGLGLVHHSCDRAKAGSHT